MNIKKIIKTILPSFILNFFMKIKKNFRLKKFYSLKKLDCDTQNLICYEKINIENIMNNKEILNSWKDWETKLASFKISDVKAGVNVGDQKAIFFLIRYFKSTSVLEIGTHVGASTINIASAINYNKKDLKKNSMFKSVDIRDVNSISKKPWLNFGMSKSPIEMVKELDDHKFVDFITNNSIDYFEKTSDTFDFIFLDGGHLPETVYQEIPKALSKLNKDGVILLHDYFPNGKPIWSNNYVLDGPFLATERLKKETDITILPLGRLPWKTKLDSNKTSLALCLKK